MENSREAGADRQKVKKALLVLLCAIVLSLVMVFLRGPYVSNILESLILPELRDASGQKVTAEKIYINLFPLFVEARGLKVLDADGTSIVYAGRVKGYVTLTGLLSRQIVIRRLAVNGVDISASKQKMQEIIKRVKSYLEKERKPVLKVKIKVIDISKGNVALRDEISKSKAEVKALSTELILGEKPKIKVASKEVGIEKEGWPRIVFNMDASAIVENENIKIEHLDIGSYGSRLKAAGSFSRGQGSLKTQITLLVDSVKRVLNLTRKGEGKLSVKGTIDFGKDSGRNPSIRSLREGFDFRGLKDILLDLQVGGNFYLQTLMEVLKVKEKLEGFVDFRGKIRGRLSDVAGEAKATLRNGNLFGVDIDSLTCDILYKDGKMTFGNGYAVLYNGTAQANASIHLPVVDSYSLNVKFNSIDSGAALKLIGWEPEIPAGKVEGELSSSGSQFNPEGQFVYKAVSRVQRASIKGYRPVDNFLNRIRDIKGNYSLRNDIISLTNLKLNTLQSIVTASGTVDLKQKMLRLASRLTTENIADLTLPYYRAIKGRGIFSGEITGPFDNPNISGSTSISDIVVEGYRVDSFTSNFSYDKKLLHVRDSILRSSGEENNMQGRILFPQAKELFDLAMPVYDLSVSLRNAQFGKVLQIFYKDIAATGKLNTDIKIQGKGKEPEIAGKASVGNGSLYGIPFDSATGDLAYERKEFSLKNLKITRGKSALFAEGKLAPEGRFSYSARSDKIFVKDIGIDRMPGDALLSLKSEGHGTFENPDITLDAKVASGTFKGIDMGSGIIKAAIRNKDISVNAALFNERMKLKGSGHLDRRLPWNAELIIQPGRYDSIISSLFKEVPEDLKFSLDGRIEMKGDRNDISASAGINHLTLSLLGQTFSNASPITFLLNNKKLTLIECAVRSGDASFKIQGGLEFGREYGLSVEGGSSLAPFKAFSKTISYLSGDAEFAFSMKGKWEKPAINGKMNVSNASFGLKGYPSYISSINGNLYMDGDRIVLQKLSGKIGAGDINMSGVLYLAAFHIKRFYLESKLENVTTTLSKDFSVDFGGDLLYKGTPQAQSITGDIKIDRAKYRQMVEWRSWLLAAKAIEKPKAELSALERTELNISISGSENISIDNNFARAPVRIRGNMILKGTIANPILFGRLESTEGYAYFRNNEFTIKYASVDFTDPNRIKPIISLTAETTIRGYTITISLEGEMDHFTLSMSSDPHLEEADILSLLAGGQLGTQSKGLEAGIGAGAASSFLTGKVQDVLEERLRTLTGLERVQVEPYVSSKTGTVGTRVVVSKRLIGDKLFVTYANPIGTSEAQVIKVEYLLEKNISLIGNRDEIGGLGGDVRFRFQFK
jgi:autotransporter translocation and assembly factor TamB